MRRLHRAVVQVKFISSLFVLITLTATLPGFAQQSASAATQTLPPRSDDDLIVALTVTVTDQYGRPIPGLSKSNFAIYENKAPQEIRFFTAEDVPLSVGIIFD